MDNNALLSTTAVIAIPLITLATALVGLVASWFQMRTAMMKAEDTNKAPDTSARKNEIVTFGSECRRLLLWGWRNAKFPFLISFIIYLVLVALMSWKALPLRVYILLVALLVPIINTVGMAVGYMIYVEERHLRAQRMKSDSSNRPPTNGDTA